MNTEYTENELNDVEEIRRSWRKTENNVKTVAVGDGVASGQENNFQYYFDQGYFEGFYNSYAIGLYKGSLFASSIQGNISVTENELLTQPKLAWCQVCANKDLSDKTASEVVAQQIETSSRNFDKLHSLYSQEISVNIELPKTL